MYIHIGVHLVLIAPTYISSPYSVCYIHSSISLLRESGEFVFDKLSTANKESEKCGSAASRSRFFAHRAASAIEASLYLTFSDVQ